MFDSEGMDMNQMNVDGIDMSIGVTSSKIARTSRVLIREPRSVAREKPGFLEFFAGSGLVAFALKPHFKAVWANDNCDKKMAVYIANHGPKHFHQGSIVDVNGGDLPEASLSWASFPCQDLSLAGLTEGINGERSGLVWQWLRIMDEMPEMPPLLVAENVTGLVSVDNGSQYRILHEALRARGYTVGAVMLDAVRWVPQSRPRVFVIAVKEDHTIPDGLIATAPNWMHPRALVNAGKDLDGWVWWNIPEPAARVQNLADIVEWGAACEDAKASERNVGMIPLMHRKRLADCEITVAPGYKRTRSHKQVLELRFDGVAGCLRTPKGGSSRQCLVMKRKDGLVTRLLTVRETARLMGAPDTFKLPGTYNDGYKAMGDAVAVPVAGYLAEHLLSPLLSAFNE